jgi:transcriptional regulator with XRE-family HTH domain
MQVIFAARLRLLREEHGMTQRQLADKIQAATSTVGMYETGKREPDTATLNAIANLFGVTVDFLVGRSSVRVADPELLPGDVQLILRGSQHLTEAERQEILSYIKVKTAALDKSRRGN